ncbi:MAG: hypothetical protein RQ745_00735 [Longimicrobiales bacterium]|nr:hypothetical protein [Longimicrobiales bacterium]
MHTTLNAFDLSAWLGTRAAPLLERWLSAVRGRGNGDPGDGRDELLESFLHLFVDLLPRCMTPMRAHADPLWNRAAELFGSFAANRGLAAGEVIEEVQILRESVIRMMYQDPPGPPTGARGLREVLHFNRLADRLVTHASVGHTDALFFALFQGSGIPEALSDEVRYELRGQLEEIRSEMESLDRHLRRNGGA